MSTSLFGNEMWENVLGNQSCAPLLYSEPTTFEELEDHLRKAVSENCRVRVVGGGFSINDICCTEGCLINMKHLNRMIHVDEEKKTVRVEAGISLKSLEEGLSCFDLTLPNLPAIDEITLGGAVSTGSHGTGHTGTLSDSILEIELLTSDGALHILSERSDPDGFAAAKLSLGALGIIRALTMQLEPLFCLDCTKKRIGLDDVLKNYVELFQSNDFFQFTWNVESEEVVATFWNKSEKGIPVYQALPFYEIDPNDKDLFSEIAIPINQLPQALQKTRLLVREFKKLGATGSDITVRFVEHDTNVFLSPAKKTVAYITFSLSQRDKFLEQYRTFENAMLEIGGRPHWGKTHFLDYEKVKKLYGDDFQKFIAAKQRFDPQGVFSNDFLVRIIPR